MAPGVTSQQMNSNNARLTHYKKWPIDGVIAVADNCKEVWLMLVNTVSCISEQVCIFQYLRHK
ncbi:hypothetical protein E2C01_041822 [Portunus trituberculatus]|uniref:Uncharacterized protein n=1 Tax=Portunus trituberculatus TaxID=210409 RepID=A0A5B7FRQ7_PORTR|nr:hypothetical protein [Portunus trituberculatus]